MRETKTKETERESVCFRVKMREAKTKETEKRSERDFDFRFSMTNVCLPKS